jgi:hypothetical protein
MGPETEPELDAPTAANTDSSLVVSAWPAGHVAGASDSLMGRRSSKVSSQVWQRYS